jgi:hypothetical protein
LASVGQADAWNHWLRDNGTMITRVARYGCAAFLAALSSTASANCESGSFPLFGCDAAKSRKFIELCAPSPLDAKSGFLRYRFGSLDEDGNDGALELEYPAPGTHTLRGFYAATYTHDGVLQAVGALRHG